MSQIITEAEKPLTEKQAAQKLGFAQCQRREGSAEREDHQADSHEVLAR